LKQITRTPPRVPAPARPRRQHPLTGRLAELHSASINLSHRITLELLIQEEQIVPVNVGDHDAVY